jgi:mannose-6-phosphate isomerase-like protein (cupin superfamily)
LIENELLDRGFEPQFRIDEVGTYYPPSVVPYMKVYVIVEGSMSLWVNREYFLLNPGTRMIVPGGMIHWTRGGADGCRYFLGLLKQQNKGTSGEQTFPKT